MGYSTYLYANEALMTEEQQLAFIELLEPVYQRLWRFALATTRDVVDAQDLLSESVLEAYERFDSLRDRKAFASFLFTIATRIQRHKERRAKWFGPYNETAASELASEAQSPEVSAEIRVLFDALDHLPTKEREAVVLFELSGFSLEEIREIQSGTLSGVKSRLRRGRMRLATLLGVDEPEASIERRLRVDSRAQLRLGISFANRVEG